MPVMFGTTAAPSNTSNPDSTNAPLLAGKSGEIVTSPLHGKFFTSAYRGRVFIGSTVAAGVILPAQSTTAPLFLIYNPLGSGVNVELISVDHCLLAATTVIATIMLAMGVQVPSGTLTPYTTITPGMVGSSAVNQAKLYSVATIVAMTQFLPMMQVTTTATSAISTHYDFDGKIILPPGAGAHVCSDPTQTASTSVTMAWAEFPI
jgi:hypothetical protein